MIFAKKSLGQNFLVDKNIVKKIINLKKIKNKNIIEIGPGRGALTNEIINNEPKNLILIEKDLNLFNLLKLKYHRYKNIKIYNKDILEFNIEHYTKKNSIIFGNLPYNISSQILIKFLKFKKWPPKFTDLIFMFQKELGEKIIGKFETNNYGRLSIISNYKLKIINKFFVSNNSFFPKPKVTSLVLHFQPNKKTVHKIKNMDNLEKITNVLFSNKRKMINKNIKKILNKNQMSIIPSLKLNVRPSEIKPEVFYKITEIYENEN